MAMPLCSSSAGVFEPGSCLSPPSTFEDAIVGAVIFDWNGLPQEYFVSQASEPLLWEKTVFQVLGLRWLLMSTLNLENFHYAKVLCEAHTAFILRQQEYYVALLLDTSLIQTNDPLLMEGLWNFQVSGLRSNPQFQML